MLETQPRLIPVIEAVSFVDTPLRNFWSHDNNDVNTEFIIFGHFGQNSTDFRKHKRKRPLIGKDLRQMLERPDECYRKS